jgi:hypothetical protein
MFKKAFSHVDMFTGLVKDFTGIHLEIDEVEHDKVFDKPVAKVNTKFDLFAEDKKNRVIVEAQHANYADNFDRFYYYHHVTMVETVASSRDYRFPMTIITLVFFTNKISPSPNSGIFVFDTASKDLITGEAIEDLIGKKHQLFFIFTKEYGHPGTPEPCREWMNAIHDTLRERADEDDYDNPLIKQLFQIISKDKTTPEERAKMKEEYSQELVERSAFNKGIEEGARRLRASGKFTDEEIATAMNLSVEEVQALK